jgi:hypothetical protein
MSSHFLKISFYSERSLFAHLPLIEDQLDQLTLANIEDREDCLF